jgi:membrane protein implicated in regulation of membrane protease activity
MTRDFGFDPVAALACLALGIGGVLLATIGFAANPVGLEGALAVWMFVSSIAFGVVGTAYYLVIRPAFRFVHYAIERTEEEASV